MDSGPRQKHYCESDFCTLSFLISRHHRGIAAQKPFPRRRAALGVRKPSKCRKRWFLANCGSSASLQPLEPGHSIDQKYTEGIGTTLTPRRLKCNAPDPAQSKRRYGQQERTTPLWGRHSRANFARSLSKTYPDALSAYSRSLHGMD